MQIVKKENNPVLSQVMLQLSYTKLYNAQLHHQSVKLL